MFDEPKMLLPTQNKEGTVFSKEAVKHNCLSQATQYVYTEQKQVVMLTSTQIPPFGPEL